MLLESSYGENPTHWLAIPNLRAASGRTQSCRSATAGKPLRPHFTRAPGVCGSTVWCHGGLRKEGLGLSIPEGSRFPAAVMAAQVDAGRPPLWDELISPHGVTAQPDPRLHGPALHRTVSILL